MSTINVKCQDQVLVLENTPAIASGGVGEDFVRFDFCNEWGGYARTAVFWRTEKEAFHQLLDENDFCAIPPEVLKEPGIFYFGVFGVNSEGGQRTSDVLPYRVNRGAITEGTKPSDPTPDIYTQLLQQYAKIEAGALGASSISLDEETAEALGLSQTDPKVKDALLGLQDQQTASDLVQAQHTKKLAEHDKSITKAQKAIDDHKKDQENPHHVTAEQAGAAAKLHAAQHAADGDDPITPDAIRAVNDIVNEAEGTNIAVADSRNAEPVGLNLFGKSTQETTTGKNLCGFVKNGTIKGLTVSTDENTGEVTVKGTSTSSNGVLIVDASTNKVTLSAGRYKLVGCPSGGSESKWFLRARKIVDGVDAGAVSGNEIGSGVEFTLDEATDVHIGIYVLTSESVNLLFKPMITTDTSATYDDFEPYTGGIPSPNPTYPQDIKSVGDGGQIVATVCGKNLLPLRADGSSFDMNGINFKVNITDGTVALDGTATANVYFSVNTEYLDAGKYVINGSPNGASNSTYFMYIDESLDFGSGCSFELNKKKRIQVMIAVRGGVTLSNVVFKPMIRLASIEDDTFEPYTAQTLTISTPNGLPGLEVTDPSLATYTDADGRMWRSDEIDFERGVYVKRVKQLTVDGVNTKVKYYGESATYPSEASLKFLTLNVPDSIVPKGLVGYAMSTMYEFVSGSPVSRDMQMRYGRNSKWFNISDSRFSNTDDANAWFASNPMQLAYILAEPIETQLTAEELEAYAAIHTNKPNTTVMNSDGAYMAMKYLRDIDDATTSYLLAKLAKGAVAKQHASTHATGGSDPLTPGDIGAAAATHARQHAADGADPITPAAIGAAAATHRHTAGQVGAAPATHARQHAADGADPITPAAIGAVNKTGDTMDGDLTFASTKAIYLQRGSYKFKLSVATGGKFRVSTIDESGDEVIGLTYSSGELGIGSSTNRAVTPKNAEELGIAQVAYGSYTGNATKDRVITCGFVPVLVFLLAEASGVVDGSDTLGVMFGTGETLLVSDMSYVYGDTTTGGFKVGDSYFNKKNGVYHYVAIG